MNVSMTTEVSPRAVGSFSITLRSEIFLRIDQEVGQKMLDLGSSYFYYVSLNNGRICWGSNPMSSDDKIVKPINNGQIFEEK